MQCAYRSLAMATMFPSDLETMQKRYNNMTRTVDERGSERKKAAGCYGDLNNNNK